MLSLLLCLLIIFAIIMTIFVLLLCNLYRMALPMPTIRMRWALLLKTLH